MEFKLSKIILFFLLVIQLFSCKKEVKKNNELSSKAQKEPKGITQNSKSSDVEETSEKSNDVLLNKENIYNVRIEKIDSIQFFKAKEQAPKPHAKPTKITDFNTAKKMLKGVVKFGSSLSGKDGVHTIYFKNGEKYVYNDIGGFIAYYPNEDILLCEGGHSIDVSFNLKNGKQTEQTGNPELMVTSPSKEFRLNAFFGGQLCNINFIQKKIHNEYENIIDLHKYFHPKADYILCIAKDAFWINDTTLFYREPSFLHKKHYFKVKFDRSEKYITAQSGLNYRTAPKGKILGKFDYGEKVEVIKHTNIFEEITDENKQLKGKWLGVRYKNDTVYIFDAFLSKNQPKIFVDIWAKFPMRKIPLIDTTNFDNIKKEHKLSINEINQLQLPEVYPNFNKDGYSYEFYPSYQLNFGEFKSIVVNVASDSELESILIIYDTDNKLIKYHTGDAEKPKTNSLIITYDEIAEGWSRTSSEIKNRCITTVDALYTDIPKIDTVLHHINRFGYINKVDTDFRNDIRPNEKLKLHKVYTDTIQFVGYNDDGDYPFIIGKKNKKDVFLYDGWVSTKNYLYKKGDLIQVKWKVDSMYIAGDGETLAFGEFAIDAKKINK